MATSQSNSLELPAPFLKVKGTKVQEEFVEWRTEEFSNLDMTGGMHPSVYRLRDPIKVQRLFYCYYTGSVPTVLDPQ